MGKRGPAPKPSGLRALEGGTTVSRRPVNEHEPQPEQESIPEPPDWLSEKATELWTQRALLMSRLRLLTRIDKDTFGRWCEMTVQWLAAKEFIEERGTVYPVYEQVHQIDDAGRPMYDRETGRPIMRRNLKMMRTFPQVAIFQSLSTELRKLEAEFGMTPASRTRISIGKEEKVRSQGTGAGFRYPKRA